MTRTFTAYIEYDSDTQMYVGTIPGLPSAHSQGATLDELRQNLKEVIELVWEERQAQGDTIDLEPFVGIQQITVDV
jgi:predicted RNase H-like HicB family nuclease